MRAHEKNRGEQHRHLVEIKPGEDEQHDEDFKYFDANRNGALAEPVGEDAAGHGKENEREREQRADEFADLVLLGERDAQAEDHEDDEIFQDVVAERALELRDEEAPEAA